VQLILLQGNDGYLRRIKTHTGNNTTQHRQSSLRVHETAERKREREREKFTGTLRLSDCNTVVTLCPHRCTIFTVASNPAFIKIYRKIILLSPIMGI